MRQDSSLLRARQMGQRALARLSRSKRTLAAAMLAALFAVPALAGSVSYTFDALGRLRTATYSNGVVITYAYDAAGNRSSQVTTGVQ